MIVGTEGSDYGSDVPSTLSPEEQCAESVDVWFPRFLSGADVSVVRMEITDE